ncbi:hypothetical protein ACSW9V_15140 (plasmid) [Clostridium perfringens]|uniref:hypothetical protein n=1 Tax=Clostridium perfringens TaxID=1502 RepID=UPI000B39819E|nr:hypothetical protein [Clostridium perfringens]EGT0690799.1 hypothetical protein [Clostridium perfringens]EGT0693578.1 hypothetical protein [Clostridium perfringens]EGT0696535.1 hypothetical protein [Clostridium perfringens]MDU3376217.1 hypothetical protein [Clostridium perfringens]MDU3534173.1 hypothetical protein [Clostridium perfringens]
MNHEFLRNEENNKVNYLCVRLDNSEISELEVFRDNFNCNFVDMYEESDDLISISHIENETFSDEEVEILKEILDELCELMDKVISDFYENQEDDEF